MRTATGRPALRILPALAAFLGGTACSSGSGLPSVNGAAADRLELKATEMRYIPSKIAVTGSEIPVVLHNIGVVIHDLRIEGSPTFVVEATPGQTSTATWQLAKGRYRIYCSIPGHRAAGMEGVLEVR